MRRYTPTPRNDAWTALLAALAVAFVVLLVLAAVGTVFYYIAEAMKPYV